MTLQRSLAAAVAGVAVAVATATEYPLCPAPTDGFTSENHGGGELQTIWRSELPVDTLVYWVDFQGVERAPSVLPAGDSQRGNSFPGHAFRVRTYKGTLIKEIRVVNDNGATVHETMSPCGDLDAEMTLFDEGRDAEFESLIIRTNCDDLTTPSSQWGCSRRLTEEQVSHRQKDEYGFLEGETTPANIGRTVDDGYVRQIAMIPKVSISGPGYMIMEMPEKLKQMLLTWYEQKKGEAEPHEHIPGGYTNNEILGMTKLNLDKFADVRADIIREMTQILQWWCGMRLRHTSTYGVRIYRRDSMLINHVDRMDTHLASAVLQVAQSLDRDGGWPLEVLLPNKTTGEVYLQPGQMVLYEGAWLRHGRPMRFKGDMFANIFTHFAPIDWKGPGRMSSDLNSPLPNLYHGYEPGRCTTTGDVPGVKGCTVTDVMESEWKNAANGGSHDEL